MMKMVPIPKDKIMTICNANAQTFPENGRYKKLLKYKVNQKLPDYIEEQTSMMNMTICYQMMNSQRELKN